MRIRKKRNVNEKLLNFDDIVINNDIDWRKDRSDKKLFVELGTGKGDFISQLAERNPDIYRGIYISIVICSAFWTVPTPDTQVLCFNILISAAMAFLTCRLEFVYLHQSFAVPLTFILQHSREHSPAVVVD